MTIDLGRLERIEDVRVVWANEALDFTPWLAERQNLRLLGEAIGIELEHEATEKSIGPFSADILCRDRNNNWVLIENQLEKTDHGHLGQLITYAAGLNAVTIVWIATPFRPEHRAALDWLNEITDKNFNFFGLEVEVWKIGDSHMAPKFNLVAKPNTWTKDVHEGLAKVESDMSSTKNLQLRFWTFFRDYVNRQQTPIKATKPFPSNWMNISIGRTGFRLNAIASSWDSDAASYDSNEIRVEFEISRDPEGELFEMFLSEKEDIETELGYPVIWYNRPEKISKRTFVKQSVVLSDETKWTGYSAWLLKHLEDFHRVFGSRIKNI